MLFNAKKPNNSRDCASRALLVQYRNSLHSFFSDKAKDIRSDVFYRLYSVWHVDAELYTLLNGIIGSVNNFLDSFSLSIPVRIFDFGGLIPRGAQTV